LRGERKINDACRGYLSDDQDAFLFSRLMSKIADFIDVQALDALAEESGLAIAVVAGDERQAAVFNNNSICRNLNPGDEFSSACAQFCGRAFSKAIEAGDAVRYECHAGLECRAVPFTNSNQTLVAIVGRTFVKAENYRKAATRSISGDWSHFPATELFENVLLGGTVDVLDKTTDSVKGLARDAKPEPQSAEPAAAEPAAKPAKRSPEAINDLVERFNREIAAPMESAEAPEAKPELPVAAPAQATGQTSAQAGRTERRTAEAAAWRSFFTSLLKTNYAGAADSILDFLANQYGFSAMIWLEKKDNRLENTAAYGEMKNRRVRLGIAADDRRLIEAAQNERPLELGERAGGEGSEGTRLMNLFPIGVGGDISAAIAILNPIEDERIKKQIARICASTAPQLEILRLRSEVARGDSLSTAIRGFNESLKHIDDADLWLNLTQHTAEMLRAERASLLIFDPKSDALEIKAIIGAKGAPVTGETIGGRVANVVFTKSEPVAVSDVAKTSLPPAPADRGYKTSSFLSCPISISGRAIGVMNFTDRAGGEAFDKRSLELFQAIVPQLAVAIDRASLKEKAGEFEQLSVTDALTGLLNRRYMEARLLEEIKRSNRHGFPMSFMMLDVDHFKSYNDAHGHPAGDEALKIVGNVIRETLRGADVAARFGGEEFAILLPQTTGEEAMTIAERIRSNIEHADFPHQRVTASIGVASCSAELCISADLVSAADKALYQAKHRGRNRVLTFEELVPGEGASPAITK
jgi:diguanylate cyclase (GGDEF)-like protein